MLSFRSIVIASSVMRFRVMRSPLALTWGHHRKGEATGHRSRSWIAYSLDHFAVPIGVVLKTPRSRRVSGSIPGDARQGADAGTSRPELLHRPRFLRDAIRWTLTGEVEGGQDRRCKSGNPPPRYRRSAAAGSPARPVSSGRRGANPPPAGPRTRHPPCPVRCGTGTRRSPGRRGGRPGGRARRAPRSSGNR